jgi:hypothetical protein
MVSQGKYASDDAKCIILEFPKSIVPALNKIPKFKISTESEGKLLAMNPYKNHNEIKQINELHTPKEEVQSKHSQCRREEEVTIKERLDQRNKTQQSTH